MVTDEQVRRLRKLSNTEKNQEIAASKAGMDPTTARRYLGLGRLPSELKKERQWRTREDPFGEVWEAVERQILAELYEATDQVEQAIGEHAIVRGEYYYDGGSREGVHWTHHTDRGGHPPGYLILNGTSYS